MNDAMLLLFTNFIVGVDSLLLEVYWRHQMQIDLDQTSESYLRTMKMPSSVVVLDGLYRASEDLTILNSIYWKGPDLVFHLNEICS